MVLTIISVKTGKNFTKEQALINIIEEEKTEGENNEKKNISPAA